MEASAKFQFSHAHAYDTLPRELLQSHAKVSMMGTGISKSTVDAIMRLPDDIGERHSSHWADFADTYDSAMDRDPAMAAIRKAVTERVPIGGGSILDLGAGTGSLTFLLKQQGRGAAFAVVDPERTMLALAKEKLSASIDTFNVEYKIGTGENIPYGKEAFDYIVTNFSLHHVINEQKQMSSDEMFRVLKPGGTLILGDQFCRTVGDVGSIEWSREILDIFIKKAYWYLENATFERMLLQMKIIPRMLTRDGENLVSTEFWIDRLVNSGFNIEGIISTYPEELLNRVIVAKKEI